tara:strand:- start:749 stop:1528 length:780 start_codon:yes stop_codon:yes gene_type:complete
MIDITNIKALLIDLEGVLYSDNKLISGSIEVIKELKKNSLKLRFLTNTTTAPRKIIFNKLYDFGFDIEEKEIFTPIIATKNYLRDNRVKRIALITNIEIIEEFNDYEITQKNPEAVIMGDIYKNFKWDILDRIFKLVYLQNAALIALHQNKYSMRDGEVSLDLGPFVKAIEYSSEKKSILMGKPEKNFFDLAVKDLNINNENILMIGDDISSDIEGSINANLKAIQVKTGKFQEKDLKYPTQPNYRLNSITELPKLLGF